jgi:hypothetical protein
VPGRIAKSAADYFITMPSHRRQLWIPLNIGWIAFAAGYLLASGGFSPNRKPVAGLPPAETPAPVPTPVAASTPVPFRWSQLESTDYATYIANLRAIGCPEQTLHDIIAGDLACVYAQKRQTLLAAQAQAPAEAQAQARQALDHEEHRLLSTLLESSPANTPAPPGASTPATAAPTSTFSLNPSAGQTSISVASAGQNGNASTAGASAVSPASAASSAPPATSEPTASAATTGADTSASSTTAETNRTNRWKNAFTPEAEAYRAKWGWQAFDAAQRAAASEGN